MFKEIPRYPEYRINENGIVITKNNHIVRPNNNNNVGRSKICLYKYDENGKRISHDNKTIHRLVAETFIPNPNNLPLVMHLDNDPLHNHVSNLKWGTQKENCEQCVNDGRKNPKYTIYKVSNGEDTVICRGEKELKQTLGYSYPKTGTILRYGPYKNYTVSIDNNPNIIKPFKRVNYY